MDLPCVSTSRRIVTICSSEKRCFMLQPKLGKGKVYTTQWYCYRGARNQRNVYCTGPPRSSSAPRNSRPSAPGWDAGGRKTPPVPGPGDSAWPWKGPAIGRPAGYSAPPSGPAVKYPPPGRNRPPVLPQGSTHQGCHFFWDADHQLRLAELLPQPGVLTRKTTDHTGADGALGPLAVPRELPPPFRQLGAVDPLPAQDLVDLPAGGPGLVHLREDPQLVRVTDGQA